MKELDLTALVVENFNNSEINMDYLTNEHLDRDVKSATEFLDLTSDCRLQYCSTLEICEILTSLKYSLENPLIDTRTVPLAISEVCLFGGFVHFCIANKNSVVVIATYNDGSIKTLVVPHHVAAAIADMPR
ncbi:hypothetical protein [Photobacterium leiognathi]|uniref:hypothetical protein n=1 Tax=Photobacterium leiognathi TaxID=553611 RepID=UPI0029817859|nr:hypothetical protein [Photobacterium leiognathi]